MTTANKSTQLQKDANTPQRIVIAIIFPIVALLLAFGIMYYLDDEGIVALNFRPDVNPSDLGESWFWWALTFAVIGTLEFLWFRERSAVQAESGRTISRAPSEVADGNVPSATAIAVCSTIGWMCFVIAWIILYSGGGWGNHTIIRTLRYQNCGFALGALLGSNIASIVTLVMGITIWRHMAGFVLGLAASATMLMSFFF